MATKSKTRAKEEQGETAVQLAEAEKADAAGGSVNNNETPAANAQANTPEEKQHDEQTAAETAEIQ